MLNRAEEAAKSSKDALVELGSGVSLGKEAKLSKQDSCNDDEDRVFDNIVEASHKESESFFFFISNFTILR